MSRENVEFVRRADAVFSRGDWNEFLDLLSDDLVTYRGPPFEDSYYGKEGYLDVTADWIEGFAEWSVRGEEFIDAGDSVIVRLVQEGRGEESGVPVLGEFWFVFTVREGKIARLGMFRTYDEALEAAGVSE